MLKKYFSIILCLLTFQVLFSQTENAVTQNSQESFFMLNAKVVLILIALLLLFVNIALSRLFLWTANRKMDDNLKTNSSINKLAVLIPLLFVSLNANAATQALPASLGEDNLVTYALLAVVLLEIVSILVFTKWIILNVREPNYSSSSVPEKESWLSSLWRKMNQFKTLEEEGRIDTGHNYDGIRELDNITPPWFTTAFLSSIVFAGIYLYRYHVAYSAPNQAQEFAIETKIAEEKHLEFLKTQADAVDENSVTMLDAAGIDAGKQLFVAQCAACHKPDGSGQVGPNLTDDYWIHKGGIKDIFTTIKYGVPEKGMKSWKDDFSPGQIAQLASFIKSLRGTNPPNPKEKQGELYVESTDIKAIKQDTSSNPNNNK